MTNLTLPEQIIDELRRAADKLTAEPHCGGRYSDCACDAAEELAALLRGLADNPTDIPRSVLDMAVRINKASADSKPVERVISDDRVEKILDKLNGFVDYGPGYLDTNLTKAVDWAAEQIGPDSLIANAFGPDTDGSAEVELANGAVIKWLPTAKQWAVTVSDDAESEVSR